MRAILICLALVTMSHAERDDVSTDYADDDPTDSFPLDTDDRPEWRTNGKIFVLNHYVTRASRVPLPHAVNVRRTAI